MRKMIFPLALAVLATPPALAMGQRPVAESDKAVPRADMDALTAEHDRVLAAYGRYVQQPGAVVQRGLDQVTVQYEEAMRAYRASNKPVFDQARANHRLRSAELCAKIGTC